jgi:ABC-type uncharacterized transport system fused permease/ATPase subunit
MARLFYHSPTYAILDECTSAVSTAMEEKLYRICRERKITCITIRCPPYPALLTASHRPALEAFHDAKLELDGNGSYNFESCHSQSALSVHVSLSHFTGKRKSITTWTAEAVQPRFLLA